jgi:Rieske 2Fe-2S family protein
MNQRTARGARTLDGKYYTSKNVYDTETETIFFKEWLYAGRVSDLDGPGSYFLVEIETENVIVILDGNAKVQAFHNVCRHRGTRLCKDTVGKCARSIQCSYHAWTFSLKGDLIGAPNMDEVDGFNKKDFGLLPVAVATLDGSIFINVDENPKPFADAFAPLVGKFDQWQFAELQIAHRITYDARANWKLVVQNYSECYHCPTLHPALNRLTNFRYASNDLEEGPILGGPMELSRPDGSMTMSGARCAPALSGIEGEDLGRIYYYTVFPNMLLSMHPEYVLIHRIERLAPDRSRVICDWLFHPDAMAKPDFDPTDAVKFWNMTNKQDWEVSELSQKGVSSRAYQPGPYAELESMIAEWDRHYLSVLEG